MFHRPHTVDDALALLAAEGGRVLAGGTDLFPAQGSGPLAGTVIDLTAIPALRGMRHTNGAWRIGAGTTWSDIANATLPPGFRALQQAARTIGSVQIQNSGTMAGNLCNASPAADSVPALLVLDASVELASAHGIRTLPLRDFITGYRRTALAPGELVTAIVVTDAASQAPSHFLKLGARAYLVISIAMVAAQIETDGNSIRVARISVGACSPVAMRLHELEADLIGVPVAEAAARVQPAHLAALAPIDDVRATAAYRRDAALTLVRRALATDYST